MQDNLPADKPVADKKEQVRQKRRFFSKNKIVLFVAVIFFWFLVFLPFAYLLAESGIMNVPVFSRYYQGPKPTREVRSSPMGWAEFQGLLADRIREQRKDKNESYRVSISEGELTGLLSGMVEQALRDSSWRIKASQIALEPESMELYLKTDRKSLIHLEMLFRAKPILENGNLRFDLLEFRLGDLRLPASWGLAIIGNVFSRDFGSWVIQVDGQKAIKDMSLARGALNVILYR